ncbi:hypothetical protein BVRB_5g107770 [Beta vulgaris subsp. vulgaris]|nr:hypothetical protein BVRB_5g107770 [Beta vulgaris subsp. vulgaris]
MNTSCRDIVKCGQKKGMKVIDPFKVFNENPQGRRLSAAARVEKMMESVKNGLRSPSQMILCVLPGRKNCDIYCCECSLLDALFIANMIIEIIMLFWGSKGHGRGII